MSESAAGQPGVELHGGGDAGVGPGESGHALAELREAYDRTAGRWAAGPSRVYDRLAEALVAAVPDALDGRLALDVGAGTGAATRALQARGARVLGLDLSIPMLLADAGNRPPAVAGDIRRLPVGADSVHLSVAAFVLSHVPDPQAACAELGRVTRRGGWVVASAFPAGARHPVKAAVDGVAARFGYRPPSWYHLFKDSLEARVGTAAGLRGSAQDAGLADVEVLRTGVELTELSVTELVAWRLDMPYLGGFVAGLGPHAHGCLIAAAEEALRRAAPPELPVLFLTARAP